MKKTAAILLGSFQAICALVVVWQVIGLLPALGWIGHSVGAGHLIILGVKLAVALIAALLFWTANRLRKRLLGRD